MDTIMKDAEASVSFNQIMSGVKEKEIKVNQISGRGGGQGGGGCGGGQ